MGLLTGGRRDTSRGSGFFFFFLAHRQTHTGGSQHTHASVTRGRSGRVKSVTCQHFQPCNTSPLPSQHFPGHHATLLGASCNLPHITTLARRPQHPLATLQHFHVTTHSSTPLNTSTVTTLRRPRERHSTWGRTTTLKSVSLPPPPPASPPPPPRAITPRWSSPTSSP